MAPTLKLKKPIKSKSTAVAKIKPKWEKPTKSISAQPVVKKIKNVNKRSFDPIKANRGVVLLRNIPHGFYEDEMRNYFGQFGLVTRVRLARSQRTGRSKGFAYIEFRVPEVAQIAANTMNNYIMFKHVLKTTYISPQEQKHNFFRKDVTFNTDADGKKSFSSAKIKSIEKEIENINRVPTDEEHAKRLKRTQKTLQKQQKKYGIDLSNIVVSGTNGSSDAPSTPKVKSASKAEKKKEKAEKKVAEKKVDTKQATNNKTVAKKEKKKIKSDTTSDDGESLLGKLVNETINDTDTSDDDFKIDHSFNASSDDSDDSSQGKLSLVDLLTRKLSQKKKQLNSMETSDSEDDEESGDDVDSDEDIGSDDDVDSEDDIDTDDDIDSDDDIESDVEMESEEDEPEILRQLSKGKKKLNKVVTSNSAANTQVKAGEKRKHLQNSESTLSDVVTSSSQSEKETVAKKKKQNNQNKKKESSEVSNSVPEAPKVAMKKKMQKQNRLEKIPLNATTSTSESENLQPQSKQKKIKQSPPNGNTSGSKEPTVTEPAIGNKNMKKKQAKQPSNGKNTSNSTLPETTTSESETPKQKLKKKKSKVNVESVAKPENVNLKVEKEVEKSKLKVEQPEAVNLKLETTKNKKNKVAPVNVGKKKKTLKPITSSLISENAHAKMKKKLKHESGWVTVSENEGATKNPKSANQPKLKTIKKNKKPVAAELDAKKVKQTPDELLHIISSKDMKQNNKLKLKKKSK